VGLMLEVWAFLFGSFFLKSINYGQKIDEDEF
jgi:hypothetical protein